MRQDTKRCLLQGLNDREFRSGAELGDALGISRAAVQKHVAQLRDEGVPIHRIPGRGYRLESGVTLLNAAQIEDAVGQLRPGRLKGLEVHPSLDSTSVYLRNRAESGPGHGYVCLSEAQTAGRGRRGNPWIATPYRNLMLSVAWRYQHWPTSITTMALALGTFIAGAIEAEGAVDVGVKWPNDLVWRGRKLGGILVDVTGESVGPCDVVVGLGLNVLINAEDGARIDQDWVDLVTVLGRDVDRNQLAARSIAAILEVLERLEYEAGQDWWWRDWLRLDVLRQRQVVIRSQTGSVSGRALGIDPAGALIVVDDSGREHHCYQGEVSVRLAS